MDSETIYLKLPKYLQEVALFWQATKIKKSRFSESFNFFLKEYNERSFLLASDIQKYRNNKTREFYNKMVVEVPFYSDYNIITSSFLSKFKSIPILKKNLVKANTVLFINKSLKDTKSLQLHTSGTTGSGLVFRSTLVGHQEQWAVWWRFRNWHGIKFGELCGYFGGRRIVPILQSKPPYYRFVKPTNQLMFSSYHLNGNTVASYVQALNKYKPPWLHGYPSFISLLASYMDDQNLRLDYKLKWISLGAENLMSHQQNIIKKSFGIVPIQHYGQAEAVANISQCPKGALHVDEDFSFIEFVPIVDNQYKIVGSNFTNPTFPLLRYDTGDIATISGKECDCGRPGRIVDKIDGRDEDLIILKNDSKVGRLDHIFKDMINVKEAQIYQSIKGKIEVRIVKGINFTIKDENSLLNEIKAYLKDIEIEIKYLVEIPKTNSNKLKFVISEIKEDHETNNTRS